MADSLGLGSRAVSMGGALTALADDFSALYYNPAGLMYPRTLEARVPDRKGIRFDFGYVYGEPRLWIRASHDESEAAQDPFSLITPLAAGS